MVLSSGVKGGLIGGVISALLLFGGSFIPGSGFLLLIMPIVSGVLAAVFMAGPRNIGSGAGAGAVGAAIAGLIAGIVATIEFAMFLGQVTNEELAAAISQGMSGQLTTTNITPMQLAQNIRDIGPIGIGACCILGGPILWALLGTLGGMLGQAFKPAAPPPSLYGQPYYGAGQPPLGYDKAKDANYPHPPAQIGGEHNPYGTPPPAGYNQPPYGSQPPNGYNQPPTDAPPSNYNQPPYSTPPTDQQPPDERGRQG